MKILIVSATYVEVAPLLELLQLLKDKNGQLKQYSYKHLSIDVLITGVGMVATAFWTGKILYSQHYELAINLGLAGSFDKTISLGSIVNVVKDGFSELCVEDDEMLIPVHRMNILEKTDFMYGKEMIVNNSHILYSSISDLPKVSGITVNTVHGNETSISKVVDRCHPTIESMEGAAFMYACSIENISYVQLRAISNYVEKRNKQAWNVPLAIDKLNGKAIEIIQQIAKTNS